MANVFEGDFLIEVTTASGTMLARAHGHGAMGQYAEFTTTLPLASHTAGPGRVTAFDYSAKDGSRIDDFAVPVTLG